MKLPHSPLRRGASPMLVFGGAAISALLLCGAGNAPVANFAPQGPMQSDLNAGGHNLTNAASITATNTITAPAISSAGFAGNAASLTNFPSALTQQGNTFNGPAQLEQTDASNVARHHTAYPLTRTAFTLFCIGDSTTTGAGVSDVRQSYPAIVSSLGALGGGGTTYAYGFIGATTAQINSNLSASQSVPSWIPGAIAPTTVSTNPSSLAGTGNAAIYWAGTNDYFGLAATGTTTSGTTTVSGLASMTYYSARTLAVGDTVSGTGIPAGATVASVNVAGSSLTLSAAATAAGTPTLSFTPAAANWISTWTAGITALKGYGYKVFVCTLPPAGNVDNPGSQGYWQANRVAFNNAIRNYCAGDGAVTLIDLANAPEFASFNPAYFAADKLHENFRGNQVVSAAIDNALLNWAGVSSYAYGQGQESIPASFLSAGAALDAQANSFTQPQTVRSDSPQLLLTGLTNPNQQLDLHYDITNNVGVIQASLAASGYEPIELEPNNGDVLIGTTTDISGAKLQVSGPVSFKSDTLGQLAIHGATNANQTMAVGYDVTNNLGLLEASIAGAGFEPLSLSPHGGGVRIGSLVSAPFVYTDANGKLTAGTTGSGLSFSGGTLAATGGSGTVTSVGLSSPGVLYTVSGSPVTGSGTLTLNLVSQSANTVLAGPSSGGSAAPSFRTLSAADIPTLNQNTTGTAANVTGTVAVANGGTGAATTSANVVFAGPTSSSGAPSYRALVVADIPTLNQNTTGTAANVTGTIAVANGGTGSTSAGTARTALGAAASGANADLTSTTALNSITGTSAVTLAAGGTNQNVNLTVTGTGTVNVTGPLTASGALKSSSTVQATTSFNNYPYLSLGGGDVLTVRSEFMLVWNASASVFTGGGSNDTGLARNAVGNVEVDNGTAISSGVANARDLTLRHLVASGTSPTLAAGTGAGTSPTLALSGTDLGGSITLTTGSSPAASATVATITFGAAYGTAPHAVVLIPANAAAAVLSGAGACYVNQAGVTTTTFTCNAGATALAASTSYQWNYAVIQ